MTCRRRHRIAAALAGLAMTVLVAAGCGGNDNGGVITRPKGTTTTGVPSTK